ncbi:MAG: hypothetical protein AB1Z55_08850, partial [Acidimicrobiia bacterium]
AADGPPEEAILADFVARHGDGWPTVAVSSTAITVPADAFLAPDGLALPAEGWEVVVSADDGATRAVSAFYYAVGATFWHWQEVSSIREVPTITTSTTTTAPAPTTTTSPAPTTTEPVTEVLPATIERTVRAPWTSAFAPWPN